VTDLEIRRVKDKQETPVKVYELIERKGEIPGTKRELLDVYEDGLSEYRKKKLQKAIDLFEKALKVDPP
jgi:adenylate cyclase